MSLYPYWMTTGTGIGGTVVVRELKYNLKEEEKKKVKLNQTNSVKLNMTVQKIKIKLKLQES